MGPKTGGKSASGKSMINGQAVPNPKAVVGGSTSKKSIGKSGALAISPAGLSLKTISPTMASIGSLVLVGKSSVGSSKAGVIASIAAKGLSTPPGDDAGAGRSPIIDALARHGVHPARAELIAVTALEPTFDPAGESLTGAGEFLSIQQAARALKHERITRLLSDLSVRPAFAATLAKLRHMQTPRCVAEVIDSMLEVIPHEHALAASLAEIRNASTFAPPEDQHRFWVFAQNVLNRDGQDLANDVARKVADIFADRATREEAGAE